MEKDPYAATASAYDLFSAPYAAAQRTALAETLPHFAPTTGPILDIGAGSGANAEYVLQNLEGAKVLALEPSNAMRSLALGRIAAHPEWFSRITVRPEEFFDATLPERIGGAIMLGVVGHFDVEERRAILADLARRLPKGAAVVLDLQNPQQPARIEPYEFTAATIGEIEYRAIAEAWPVDGETMRWRMSYLTIDGDRVLTEDTIEHIYHHPQPHLLQQESADAGFECIPLATETFWMLIRR